MDTRTGEITEFPNNGMPQSAMRKNPYLKPVNCNVFCEFLRKSKDEKTFCLANRKQRRKLRCFKVKNAEPKEDPRD